MSMQCKQGSGFPTSKKVCKCLKCELKHLPLHYNFCIEIWLQAIHVYESKTLKARRTRQSKQCEFCIYLLDNSLNQSKWSGWSSWSVLLGAEDGQGVQRRVVNKENCGIVGFMGTLMIRNACTLTDRQWKVGPS